jgi:hypothetical protein
MTSLSLQTISPRIRYEEKADVGRLENRFGKSNQPPQNVSEFQHRRIHAVCEEECS